MSDPTASQEPGILPRQVIREMIVEGQIRSKYTVEERQLQPSSLDLRLGEKAYRVQCSFLPNGESVARKLEDYEMYEIDLRDGAILERGAVYIIPLLEELRLPEGIRARGNPRSSTGRIDVFTRLLTDESRRFDEVAEGYQGPLYVEVFSNSFTVRVQTGACLGQLRFVKERSAVSDDEVMELHHEETLLYDDGGRAFDLQELPVFHGLYLSVSLRGFEDGTHIGYRARRNAPILDVTQKAFYEIPQFWEPVHHDARGRLMLGPEEFYLLRSKERVALPPSHAAEMVAYEPGAGELRSHYAGFFDPGFGWGRAGEKGTVAVMEVRAHDAPFMIEDGQVLCKLQLERMAADPDVVYGDQKLGSAYQAQGLTPSRHFRGISIEHRARVVA